MRWTRCAVVHCAIALLLAAPASAEQLWGRVVGAADGDTITVLDANRTQYRVRLNGIDAPESGQPFGQASKQALLTLILSRDVVVVWSKVDRYGRRVGTVYLDDVNANLEQLKAGLAWYYRGYERDVAPEHRPLYAAAEAAARASRRGLWHDADPVAPWTFRSPAVRTQRSAP